jgi:hypothetical protein
MRRYEVDPGEKVRHEIEQRRVPVDELVGEATRYLESPDVDDVALARMFIERGHSEELSYWLVREAEVRHAPEAR